MKIQQLKIFLARHPRLRFAQRRFRKFLRKVPIFGSAFLFLEKKLLLYHAAERYNAENPADAHEYFHSYAEWILPRIRGSNILDLGCGYGYLTKKIADKAEVSAVLGIDKISPEEFRFLGHSKVAYQKADIMLLDELPGVFDTIVATEFIEHIAPEALERLLGLVKTSLKPSGIFLGSTPDGSVFSGSPFHRKEYSKDELEVLLRKYFDSVQIELLDTGCLVWQAIRE